MKLVKVPSPESDAPTWLNPERVIMVLDNGAGGSSIYVDSVTLATKVYSTLPPEQLINLLAGAE